MKNINMLFKAVTLLVFSLIFVGCSEDLVYDKEIVGAPVITDFSPKLGSVGTEITITGENLAGIDTVYIGGALSEVKYRVSATEMVAVVTANSKTGVIKISGNNGHIETTEKFTVEYKVPTLKTYPVTAKPYDQIYIEGTDLNAVSEVYFGTTVGKIITQSKTDLIVEVPFFEDDNVDILLNYNTADGIKQTGTTGKPFSIESVKPNITNAPAEADAGANITLAGTNMNLIEEVWFGQYKATIIQKDEVSLTVTVPANFTATANVVLKVIYNSTREIIVNDNFKVVYPEIHYWSGVTIYGQDPSTTGNFFNALNGRVYDPCQYTDNKLNIHFYLTISTTGIAFNNPKNGINQIKNFKCNGTNLPSDTVGVPNVKFRKLLTTSDADKIFIDQVKSKTLKSISVSDLETAGVTKAGTSSFRHNGEAGSANYMYEVGDVILFEEYEQTAPNNTNAKALKVGFLEILNITTTSAVADKTSSVTFNCYFQK